MTLNQRIVKLLEKKDGLTDREITDILYNNSHPQQSVNQACNKLKNMGILNRSIGEKHKIQNYVNYSSISSNEVCIKNIRELDKAKNYVNINTCNNLNIGEYTLIKLEIKYYEFNLENIFSKLVNKTVAETIRELKYKKFKEKIRDCYSDYLELSIGTLLFKMKQNHDNYYLEFLNANGDNKYCRFKLSESNKNIVSEKGLYIYRLFDEIVYIGRCRDSFKKRFNNGYGNISPKNCYIDGQSTNCHINSRINQVYENLEVYVLSLNDNRQIEEMERKFIKEFNPRWNIALKR